jgi:ATP-dependent phosphofructokinase / diphosphate-dependent phosphofructokinase
MSAAVVLHSGGPTPVINASLLGVVEEARRHRGIAALYGARHGIGGVLREDFADLFSIDVKTLAAIARAPSSALGTSRDEVREEDLDRAFAVLRKRAVHYLFYTGGNGSMGAAFRIERHAKDRGYVLQVVGIPKTIDNDLTGTDHTPGYATAARFFACAVRDIGADNRSLPGQVEFIEVLGRNSGWLVAATALARHDPDDAPHLIYFPEARLPLDQLFDDVDRVYRRLGRCVVSVCEGQLDENDQPFGADVRSGSRGTLAMNVAHRFAILVMEKLRLRARSEKPGLLARSGAAYPCELDWNEARLCGQAAVRAAAEGASGVMVGLAREAGAAYSVRTTHVPLEEAAHQKLYPAEWRNAAGNDVQPAFLDYAAPLVGAIPCSPAL